mgnify:CR=1 FL=1
MKVRNLLLTLALALGASSVWAVDNVSIVKPMSIKAGETKTIAVALDNSVDYTAFQFDIKLPTGLTIKEGSIKSLRADASHTIESATVDGATRVVAYSAVADESNNITDGNKPFTGVAGNFILKFDVEAANTYSNGNIEVSNVIFATPASVSTEMAAVSSVDGAIFGDADNDKDLTAGDASLVLQFVANKITADKVNYKAIDVDVDGSATAGDASLILQKVAGKISK